MDIARWGISSLGYCGKGCFAFLKNTLTIILHPLSIAITYTNSNLFSCKTTLETSKRSAAQNQIKGNNAVVKLGCDNVSAD